MYAALGQPEPQLGVVVVELGGLHEEVERVVGEAVVEERDAVVVHYLQSAVNIINAHYIGLSENVTA